MTFSNKYFTKSISANEGAEIDISSGEVVLPGWNKTIAITSVTGNTGYNNNFYENPSGLTNPQNVFNNTGFAFTTTGSAYWDTLTGKPWIKINYNNTLPRGRYLLSFDTRTINMRMISGTSNQYNYRVELHACAKNNSNGWATNYVSSPVQQSSDVYTIAGDFNYGGGYGKLDHWEWIIDTTSWNWTVGDQPKSVYEIVLEGSYAPYASTDVRCYFILSNLKIILLSYIV